MNFWLVPPVIRIEFPALDRLIDFWIAQGPSQAQIDELTAKLTQAEAGLKSAVESQTP